MTNITMDAVQTSQVEVNRYPLYFSGLVLAMIFFLVEETTFYLPELMNLFVKLTAVLFLILHIVSVFSKYTLSWKIVIVVTFFLSVVIGQKCDHLTLLVVTWAAIFGAKDIPKERLLKVYFKTSVIFCALTICMALGGFIENKVILNLSGSRETIFGEVVNGRACFGYIWPTDFATHVFYIFMTYWLLKDGRLSMAKIVIWVIATYILLSYTDSRLGCGCIILLLISGILLNFLRKRKEDKAVKPRRFRLSFLLILWIPFLAILSLWATAMYDETDLSWIATNIVLSGRLGIGQEALVTKGIPLLGQFYKLRGGETDENLYNYIDSSYLQLFIIYGLVYTVLILSAYIKLGYQSYRRRDNNLLVAIFIAGISGVIAQHFIQFIMNPLLLLLFTKDENHSDIQYAETEVKEEIV